MPTKIEDEYEFDDEIDEEDIEITDPFDPREIDISMEVQNVRVLIELLEDHHVDLNTAFQRSRDLWATTKMSRLIESFLIRLPVPPFYFAALKKLPPDREHQLQVVDGLQRLSAIQRFAVDKKLKLRGLSFLKGLEGATFDSLDKSQVRALQRAQVTTYTIRPGTPKKVTHILFERLNTGGLQLKPQEIRHALNQGAAADFLVAMTKLPKFKALVNISSGRMQDRELALRHVAFRMTSPEDYKKGLKRFLDDSMENLAAVSEVKRRKWMREFTRALDVCEEIFGVRAFHRSKSATQMNRSLFEVLTVNIAQLSKSESEELISKKAEVLKGYIELVENDAEFNEAIFSHTSDPDRVQYRFSGIDELIGDTLSG